MTEASSTTLDAFPVDLQARLEQAVEPLQMAAILESGGITDDVALTKYDAPTVFDLGDRVFSAVSVVPRTTAHESTERRTFAADLGRGAIYAIPSLFFLASRRVVEHRLDVVVLVIATVCSWAAAQASSSLANAYLGRGDSDGARGFLRGYIAASVIAGTIAAVALHGFTDVGAVFSAVAAFEVVYVASATALLMFDRDILHALTLAPGLIVTAIWLSGNPFHWTNRLTLGLIAASLIITVSIAVGTLRNDGPQRPRHLARRDYLAAGLLGVHGAIWALILASLSIAFLASGLPAFSSVVPEGVILPVVVSMGLAERSLRRFRHEAQHQLIAATDRTVWRRSIIHAFHRALLRYVASVEVLTLIALAVFAVQRRVTAYAALLLLAFGILGAAFFLGLLSVALARVRTVVLWSALSGTCLGLMLAAANSASANTTALVLAAGHLLLLVGLYVVAFTTVTRVAAHR